jgi:hypothetical protein
LSLREKLIHLSDAERKKIAETIREKHDIIKEFLHSVLMLPKSDSDAAACEIEHAISTDTALRPGIVRFLLLIILKNQGYQGKNGRSSSLNSVPAAPPLAVTKQH